MAKVFNFSGDHLLTLEIEGEKFTIDTTDVVLLEAIEGQALKVSKMAKDMKGGTEDLRRLIKVTTDFIELILGEGATKKIFKDGKISLLPALDLLDFVTNSINEFRAKKLKDFANKQRDVRK